MSKKTQKPRTPKAMQKQNPAEPRWYNTNTSLFTPLGAVEQAEAFAALVAAQRALRTHLHGCAAVVGHILTKARAAASGRQGSKNEAKKFFVPGGPTHKKIEACSDPASLEALSSALHSLGGKQALYSECASLVKEAAAHGVVPSFGEETDSKTAFLARLKALDFDYIQKRNHLVTRNLRLVASVIQKLHFHSMPWEDLMQYGAIGLQKAVESFDPSKGGKFSTYAVPVIRGELLRAMENFGHSVRIPSHLWVKIRSYNRMEEELGAVLGRTPSHVEMALELGITILEAAQLQQYQWAPVSLDASLGQAEDGMCLADTLIDRNARIPGGEMPATYGFEDGFEAMEGAHGGYAGDGVSPREEAA